MAYDGSRLSKPKRSGGIGYLIIYITKIGEEKILYESDEISFDGSATAPRMELRAAIEGLKKLNTNSHLVKGNKIIVRSDATYLRDNIYNARFIWPPKWLKSSGEPVRNAKLWKDLIKQMDKAYQQYHLKVEFQWVKGHKDDTMNIKADSLAKASAKSTLKQKDRIMNVRRKTTNEKVVRGSVEMKGQVVSIRITDDEYLELQQLYCYTYEVISKKSEYYDKRDIIYSTKLLSAGHHYKVTFNKDSNNPRILKMLKELKR